MYPSSSSRALVARCLLLLLTLFACGTHAAGLPAPVRTALQGAGIALDDVAIWVQPVDARMPVLAHNAEKAMNPASVMKLVTAFAALERLGPAYTWTTRIARRGEVRGTTLHGDLYIVGGADPMLGYERLWKILRQLRALGITHIAGDIVLDGSALALPPHDPDAFDGRGLRPYNSGPHGLLLHYNTVRLTLIPGAHAGEAVQLAADPPLAGISIDNRIVTAAGPCGTWHHGLEARLQQGAQGPRLELGGRLPASCGRRDWSAAPLSPEAYGIALVAALWQEVGGHLDGRVRSGLAPADASTVLNDSSESLGDVVRNMNKWSSNIIARQMLATLGATAGGVLDMVSSGAVVARAQLDAAGIDTDGLVIENGAGLSRIERIRADTLGQLLLTAWQRPWMPDFVAALPMAGVDGTARRRLNGSPANGQAHIKTGTLNGVRAMGGYVLDRHGRRHAVVMMVNHAQAPASHAAQDALLEWVWEGR
ncbi:D-alanyl-D-alanine carboxypeptidase/D-alanyl-D-alanine endopeptidase [Pseudothauera lacus]|uniref:D-alanyl-D-alanine carboxypeptidase/D-alanyl-D-alanine-endopeptidase n=1 Tax=Pseudothauera lacus TaxID=2136175 RepID=A0A2T4IDS1_9RHOO|nr:D-alanyl-D-alanine carboxypeptidase/D-alanyl-D-alanine-endopeptidase [Pseudothauera lacus]PTD95922.1 D-alanyl-D-alanine carboxypeptidase/D-alanyl-D-alanine-endopeptidase [Pseudothauera lacus]